MASEPIFALLDASALQRSRLAGSTVLSDYWALTKPEINFLIAEPEQLADRLLGRHRLHARRRQFFP